MEHSKDKATAKRAATILGNIGRIPKRLYCPYCKKTVKALPWHITEDGKMFDWCCPECEEPIKTEQVPKGMTIVDCLRKVSSETFPIG